MTVLTPVTSSNIEAMGHNPITLVLSVKFKSGKTYDYANVPTRLYDELLKADSIGSAFSTHIKSQPEKYPYTLNHA